MNCDGVQELLSAYVDGELSPGELLRVEQHLRRCPRCAEDVDALRQAIAFVGALEEVELPSGFREGLRARLAQVSPQLQPVRPATPLRPAWHRQVKRWVLPAAAAAAFALATTGVYGQLGPLLNRVADSGPHGSVNTPIIDTPTTSPVETPPPTVALVPGPGTPNPVTPLDGNTNPVDPADSNEPKVNDKPPTQNPETHLGPDAAGGTKVASFVANVNSPEKLPAQIANRTTVLAVVPDLTAACTSLKSAFPAAECSTKVAGQSVQVRFTVEVARAAEVQAQVTTLIGDGATVKTEGINRAEMLNAQYQQIITIQADSEKLAQAVNTAKDATQKQLDATALAARVDEGNKAVADYKRLEAEVKSQLFVIDFQKQGQ